MLYQIFIPRLFAQGYYFFALYSKPKFKYSHTRQSWVYATYVRFLWFEFGVACIPF
jgi:hypothetical protein